MIGAVASLPSQDARRIGRKALLAYQAREHRAALALFREMWDAQARHEVAYNAACAAALAGDLDEAFQWIDRALAAGFDQFQHLEADPDLASLQGSGDARWARVLDQARAAAERTAAAIERPELAREIIAMSDVDQEFRTRPRDLGIDFRDAAFVAEMEAMDDRHMTRMKEIVAAQGWPGQRMVGTQAAHHAWLLVQHASDLAFQKQCLELLEKAVAEGDASPTDLAYLYDRIQISEEKPQRYGTQFHDVDGQLVPLPIEDPEHVDERRRAVGLPSLEEYTQNIRQHSQTRPKDA